MAANTVFHSCNKPILNKYHLVRKLHMVKKFHLSRETQMIKHWLMSVSVMPSEKKKKKNFKIFSNDNRLILRAVNY